MRAPTPALWPALALSAAALTGCDTSGMSELERWMAEQNRQARPKVQPLLEPVQSRPRAYEQGNTLDPFSSQRLALALRQESGQASANAALVAPELSRRKEALEAYPLDAMAMVGSLLKAGQPVALVRVDNLLYQVRVGSYLGQNYGLVTQVNETKLVLREIVQDSTGEWTERIAGLQLQERTQ